jgi:hypothetical protein
MALRYVDGFDTVAVADLGLRWSVGSTTPSIVTGRFAGSAALRTAAINGTPSGLARTYGAQATWIVGAAVRLTLAPDGLAVFQLRDAGTDQCCVTVGLDGRVSVRRGRYDGTVVAGPAAPAGRFMRLGYWYFVEWRVTVDPAVGTTEVRVDGETWLTATGLNTRASANSSANQVALGAGTTVGGSHTEEYDDLYVCDATGSVNNDFLGDVRVATLRPTGAGANTGLTLPWTGAADYRTMVLTDSPLHFWELQETSGLTAADTGTGTAAVVTFATRGFAAGPLGGNGTDLGASSAGVSTTQADMNVTGDVTIECWVYIPAYTGADAYVVARGATNAWTYLLGMNSAGLPRWGQLATAANVGSVALPLNRWFHYVGVRQSTTATLYLDGVALGTALGATGSSSANPVVVGAISAGAASGGNQWPGRIAYVALYNSALTAARIQAHAAFAPFATVDDAAQDGDTSYLLGTAAGQKSTFAFEDTAANVVSVKGVQLVTVARKDDAGVRTMAPVVRSGGTDYVGTTVAPGTTYAPALQVYETNPATSAAWTKSGVDGAEFGVQVVS